MRKTIKVDELRNFVNLLLKQSSDNSVEFREGAIFVLEQILITTDNYKGYTLNSREDETRRNYL